jgi:hypothetical protein
MIYDTSYIEKGYPTIFDMDEDEITTNDNASDKEKEGDPKDKKCLPQSDARPTRTNRKHAIMTSDFNFQDR